MRREEIKRFFDTFPAANRDQLARLFFSDRSNPILKCTQTMQQYRQDKPKWIDVNKEKRPYVYFAYPLRIKKQSAKLDHWMALVDVYHDLKEAAVPFEIVEMEYSFGKGYPQPDLILQINDHCLFVEVQRTKETRMQKKIDQYRNLFIKSKHEIFCKEFVIWLRTDRKYKVKSEISLIQCIDVKELMSSLDNVMINKEKSSRIDWTEC